MSDLAAPERAKKDAWSYFNFGLSVEKHVTETLKPGEDRLRKSLGTIIDVARGDLTLCDTPEEYAQNLPAKWKFMVEMLPEVLPEIREDDREIAKELMAQLGLNLGDDE